MEEHDARAVDVGPNRCRPSAEDLGGEVERRPRRVRARSRSPFQLPPRPEVHQDQSTVFGLHQVLRLDVPVEEAGLVDRRERPAELDAHPGHLPVVESLLFAEDLLQVPPVDELHPETDPAVDLVRVVDGDDVGMADARQQAGFLENGGTFRPPRRALARDGAARVGDSRRRLRLAGVEELDRHLAVELRVPGPEDLAEGSLPDALQDLQPAPALQPLCRDPVLLRDRRVAGDLPVKLGDSGEDLELPDDFRSRRAG